MGAGGSGGGGGAAGGFAVGDEVGNQLVEARELLALCEDFFVACAAALALGLVGRWDHIYLA